MIELELQKLTEVAMKLMLALVCGGLLGLEGGRKKRPAGFRTYMLVCVGAALVMMTNQYISDVYQMGDTSRLGAQVINGVGFLGAGTIITTGHNRVKGLSTAAGLWAAACVGLAIGIEFYVGAIIGVIVILIILVFMRGMDDKITGSAKIVTIYIEFERISILKKVTVFLKEKGIKISDIETEEGTMSKEAKAAAIMTLRLPNSNMRMMLEYMLGAIEGVTYVEEI